MGSKCSKVGMEGVIQPSKRVPEDIKTVVIASKNNKRGSIASGKQAGPGERTADTVKSPDNPLGTATKPKSVVGELTNYETYANNDNLNDTYPTTTPTTADTTSFKRLFQYKKGPLIGKGTYGDVYECLNLNSGELLAVKSFKIRGDPFRIASYIEALKKEMSILKSLHNMNIVRYYSCEISEDKEQKCSMADIILEYVSGGSVRKLLDKFGKLEEKVVSTYIRQVLEGLAYLHLNDIVHRNLKGSNILIDTTGTIKLTDFGCSGRPERFSEENPQDQHRSVPKSSVFWSAPEVVMRKSQGKPADMWSVGCVIIEMLTGESAWKDYSMEEFTRKISSGAHPPLPEGISDNCKDFLLRTFKFDPDSRPSPLDLLEHIFVREEHHDTSYMEAESVQTNTYQTFSSGNKALDLGGAPGDSRENRKYLDLKSNNFTRKQIGTNVSMSNINLGRVLTSEFAPQQHPYSQGNSGPNSIHNSIKQSILAARDSHGNLQGVREAQYEDEQSPEPGFHNQLYKFGRTNTKPKAEDQQEENLTKEEKRRRLEAEMEKELLKVNTGNLGEEEEEEDVEKTNIFNIENYEQQRQEPYRKSIMPAPVKNSLFSTDEENPKRSVNEMVYSAVNMNISEYKPAIGQSQGGGQPGYLGYTGAMWDSRHLELKNSAMSKNSQEDYDAILGRGSTGNMAAIKEDVSMHNSETETAKKERLRRQFEEQMEVSLQRVNSEKYYGERDENSEMSEGDTKLRGLSSVKKHPEEETYTFNQVLPRFSAEDRRDTWKNEESTSYIERIQGKKFEEDLVGVFRGVWDGQSEGMDHILRRDSNQLFDNERRVSDPMIHRYNPEDSKSTQEPFSGLAGQRNSPEGQDYDHDRVYHERTYQDNRVIYEVKEEQTPAQEFEEDQEKLGIINEAEELKEDSWNQDGTYRKRQSSQEIF